MLDPRTSVSQGWHDTAVAFEGVAPALEALAREEPDVLITDIRMPRQSGLDLLRRVRETRPISVIVMTAYSNLDNAVSAYERAFEYLPKPFDLDHAVALVRRAASANAKTSADTSPMPEIPELLGVAPAMQQVFRAIGRLGSLQRHGARYRRIRYRQGARRTRVT